MLESLRKSASGIIAKILMGLLIVSFAVWGIGDMVRSYGRDVIATVGDRQISANEFRQAYQLQVQNFSQQFGRRLTPQEAKVFGIEQQVLQRLTGAAAVDNHTEKLGLDITPAAVEQAIVTDPAFQGPDGKFEPLRMQEVLRRAGYSENQFFEARKRDTIRDQLTGSLLASVQAPNVLKQMIVTYQDEKRVAEYFELAPEKVVKLPAPTDDQLKKTYDSQKSRFSVPEYRKFNALLLTREAARKQVPITDAELKSTYEAEKDSFALPEQRRIQQISFPDKAAAEKALAEIKAGKDFMAVAKASGANEKDVDLGLLTKAAMIDSKIADAAFALPKDTVSDVVEGQLSTVLLRVTDIKEGRQRPFEDVKDQIRDQIADQQVGDKMVEIQNSIDDNRLAGKSLKEIAESLGLPFITVAATDRDGKTPDAKPAIANKDADNLIATAFKAEVGVENQVTELPNDGLAWVNLIAVTPEKLKPFDEVRDEVVEAWQQDETRTRLREEADKLAKKINDGTSFASVAAEVGATVKTTPAFKRGDSLPDFAPSTVSRAFAMPAGRAAAAEGTATKDEAVKPRIILQVTKVEGAEKLSDAKTKALDEELSRALGSDIIQEYVTGLEKTMAVTVNRQLLDQTTGANVGLN